MSRRREEGFILIVALAVMSILAVLSMSYAHLARKASEQTSMAADRLTGFYAAESGIVRARARLSEDTGAPDSLAEPWHDSAPHGFTVGEWTVSVRVSDDESKINLNVASMELLTNLFSLYGIKYQDRDILVDSLMDWIDTNELHRLNGAESDYYKAQGFAYGAKNAPIESIAELTRVRGFPADLLERRFERGSDSFAFADCVRSEGDTPVNINTALAPVLRAIGLNESEISAVLQARAKSSWTGLSSFKSAVGAARYELFLPMLATGSTRFSVESTAARPSSPPVTVHARFLRANGKIYMSGFWM